MNKQTLKHPASLLAALLSICLLAGCASTQTANGEVNPDPIENANRGFYKFNDALDRHIMMPVAKTYVKVTSEPVRQSVTNFFDNLEYLNVILHSFLQGKIGQGVSDMTRFVVNSAFGIGGLFDVATPMGLEKHEEDFGQTLAVWGVDQGAYLYLPLFGPNTARNTPDFASSYFSNPLTYLSLIYTFPATALNLVNERASLLEASQFVEEASIDPYAFIREAYLQQRNYLIHDGDPPLEGYDDILNMDFEESESILVIE